jgi:hypothetical protein
VDHHQHSVNQEDVQDPRQIAPVDQLNLGCRLHKAISLASARTAASQDKVDMVALVG